MLCSNWMGSGYSKFNRFIRSSAHGFRCNHPRLPVCLGDSCTPEKHVQGLVPAASETTLCPVSRPAKRPWSLWWTNSSLQQKSGIRSDFLFNQLAKPSAQKLGYVITSAQRITPDIRIKI